MASNSNEKNEEMKVINIPIIAYRSFIYIAEKNSVHGNQLQTMCYLLGPIRKTNEEEVWIDTVIIPKQICTVSSGEDNGIEEQDTITYLREMSLTKNKEIIAWLYRIEL